MFKEIIRVTMYLFRRAVTLIPWRAGYSARGGYLRIGADGFRITKDDASVDITCGTSLLMAAYWIFGFQCPKALKKL